METIRRQLGSHLPFTIQEEIYSPHINSLLKPAHREFDPRGKTVLKALRKGKLLHFQLNQCHHILSHLGMSGSWRISQAPLLEKHNHLQLRVCQAKGKILYLSYIDPRRFGNLYFFGEKSAQHYLHQLGVDISTPQFNLKFLAHLFKRFPQRQLKPFLLEQKYLSGIGNYMACEICALARVRPSRRLKKITQTEVAKIYWAIGQVIKNQVSYRGLSFSGGYRDAYGNDGGGLQNLVVFHQKICGLCQKTHVKKKVLGQRGTFYCPHCQR